MHILKDTDVIWFVLYTISQFLFATISFHNLSEINWFAVTYFHNQHVDYPENKVPEIIWELVENVCDF